MKTLKLYVGSNKTKAHEILERGCTEEGASVTRRQKGYSDFDVIRNLQNLGWLEPKPVGIRGGMRYFTTQTGIEQMKKPWHQQQEITQ